MSDPEDYVINIGSDDNDIDLLDMLEKGYREDVSIRFGAVNIRIVFYTPERLMYQLSIWKELNFHNFMLNGVLIVQDKIDNASVREELGRLIRAGVVAGNG